MLSRDDDPLHLLIEAQDGMHDEYPQFRLIIVLQDVNDNPPIIAPPYTSLSVLEVCDFYFQFCATYMSISDFQDTELGFVLVEVEASDADSGNNGFFYFYLDEPSVIIINRLLPKLIMVSAC